MAIRYDIFNDFRKYMIDQNESGVSIFEITGTQMVDGREVEIYSFKPEFLAKYADTFGQLIELSEEEIAEANSRTLPDDAVLAARATIEALHKDGGHGKYSEGQLRSMEVKQLMNPFTDPDLTSEIDMLQSAYVKVTRELLIQKYFGADLGASLSSHEFMLAYDSFYAHLNRAGKLNNIVHGACANDPLYGKYLKSSGYKAELWSRAKETGRLSIVARATRQRGDEAKADKIRGIIKKELVKPTLKAAGNVLRGRAYANMVQLKNTANNVKDTVGGAVKKTKKAVVKATKTAFGAVSNVAKSAYGAVSGATHSALAFTAKHWNNLKKKTKAFFGIKDSAMAKFLNGGPIPDIFIAASLETLNNALEELKKNPPKKERTPEPEIIPEREQDPPVVDPEPEREQDPPVANPEPEPEQKGFIIKNGDQYLFVPYTVDENNVVVKGEPQPIEKAQLSIEQLNQVELGIANIEIDVVGNNGVVTAQKVPHVVEPALLGASGTPVMLAGDNLFAYNYARLTGMPRPKDKSFLLGATEMAKLITISGTAEQKEYEIVRRREFAKMLTDYEMGQNEILNEEVSQLINSHKKEFDAFKKSPDRVFEDEATAQFAYYYHITDANRATAARPATDREKLNKGDNLAIVSCDENGKNAQYVHFKFDTKNNTFIISEVYDANATKRTRGIKNITPEEVSDVRQSMQDGIITIHHDGETYSFVKGLDENGKTTYQPYEEFKQTSTYLSTVVLADEFEMFREDGQTLVDASREFMGTAPIAIDEDEMKSIERRKEIVRSYQEFISDDFNLLEAEQFMKDNERWYEADKERYKDMPEEVRLFRFKWDREHRKEDPILNEDNNKDIIDELNRIEEEDIDFMGDGENPNPERTENPAKKPVPSGIEDLAADALWLDMYNTLEPMKEANGMPKIGSVVMDILRVASKQEAQMDPEKRKARMQEILVETYTNHAMKELIENFHLIKDGKDTEIMAEISRYGVNLEDLNIDPNNLTFNRHQFETIAKALAGKKYQTIVDLGMEESGMARVALVELSKGKYNNAQGIDWANAQITQSEDGSLKVDGRRDSKFYRALVESGIEFSREKYEEAIRTEIANNINLQNEATNSRNQNVTLEMEDNSEIDTVKVEKDGVIVYVTKTDPPQVIEAEEIAMDNSLIKIDDVIQTVADAREREKLTKSVADRKELARGSVYSTM